MCGTSNCSFNKIIEKQVKMIKTNETLNVFVVKRSVQKIIDLTGRYSVNNGIFFWVNTNFKKKIITFYNK